MEENTDEIRITSWDTYKILNRIKENVQQKRRIAKEVFVPIYIEIFFLKIISLIF